MKPPPFAYHSPTSLGEALATLADLGEDGKVLAGGQSLVPMMNMRLATPAALVDIGGLDELDTLEVTEEHVRVGARVRHARLERDDEVASALPLLRQAISWVAHPVIRNRGTVVGSIAHADPAAELPAVLALLGGHVELACLAGTRIATTQEYLVGPLESDTRPGELAVAAVFPVPPVRTGSAFLELARRHGDYALAGVAVTVCLDDALAVNDARAAFIGVGPTPELTELGNLLAGQRYDALEVSDAVDHVRGRLRPSDDIHATAAYRRHLAGVLLMRALRAAALDAAGKGPA